MGLPLFVKIPQGSVTLTFVTFKGLVYVRDLQMLISFGFVKVCRSRRSKNISGMQGVLT